MYMFTMETQFWEKFLLGTSCRSVMTKQGFFSQSYAVIPSFISIFCLDPFLINQFLAVAHSYTHVSQPQDCYQGVWSLQYSHTNKWHGHHVGVNRLLVLLLLLSIFLKMGCTKGQTACTGCSPTQNIRTYIHIQRHKQNKQTTEHNYKYKMKQLITKKELLKLTLKTACSCL